MSDVVKLNLRASAFKVKFNDEFSSMPDDQQDPSGEKEEDYIQLQLQNQYDKGYAEGRKAAAAELEKEYTQKLLERTEEFNRILSSIESSLSDYDESFDKIVIDVAVAIAEKIVRHEVNQSAIISPVLRESVRKILGANDVIIKLNPNDFSVLHSEEENIFLEESFSKIKFEQDEKIEEGGCIVETDIGNVDSRIGTQISEVKKHLDAHFINQVT